jgi:hypothetical protein
MLAHALLCRPLEMYQRGDSGHRNTKRHTITAGNMALPIISRQFSPVTPDVSGTL